jgi:hypothetical protein
MKIDMSKEQWVNIKKQGSYKYILFHWIISVALPLSFVFPALRALIYRNFIFSQFLINIFTNIIVLNSISIILGLKKWKKYSKLFS